MPFVYHIKRPDFRGTTIYPLHRLKEHFPDLFEREVGKYAGRESALEFRLPLLNVLWNDVVHCAPIHPHLIFAAMREAGYSPSERTWFQIPVDRIKDHQVLYWENKTLWAENAPPAEFKYFDVADYQELTQVPDIHMDYLREQFRLNNQGPLFAARLPHILVHGPIDVSDLATVRWDITPQKA